MQVDEIMDTHVLTISVNDYAIEARRLMAQFECEWIIALDHAEVAGVVLAGDLRNIPESILKERDVREFVSGELPRVSRTAKPREAQRLLRQTELDFLTVMDDDWPIGIVTGKALAGKGKSSGERAHKQAG